MNHYEVLEVSPKASEAVIKAAYKSLVQFFHPDRNKTLEAEQKIKDINVAYSVLSDPKKRADYDRIVFHSSTKEKPEKKEASVKKDFRFDDVFSLSRGPVKLAPEGLYYQNTVISTDSVSSITFYVNPVTQFGKTELEHTISVIGDKQIDIVIYKDEIEIFNKLLVNIVNHYADAVLRNMIKTIEDKKIYKFFNCSFTSEGFILDSIKTNFQPYLISYKNLAVRNIEGGKMEIYDKRQESMSFTFTLKSTPNALLLKHFFVLATNYPFKKIKPVEPIVKEVIREVYVPVKAPLDYRFLFLFIIIVISLLLTIIVFNL